MLDEQRLERTLVAVPEASDEIAIARRWRPETRTSDGRCGVVREGGICAEQRWGEAAI